jgi:ubiquinone/menaquinone biosynthesis C-methylase UbiE
MIEELFPHSKEMADESMVRTLRAQAEALWPQEAPLFRRYSLRRDPDVLDAGCGTGEITTRLALLFPEARVLGVDLLANHLALARQRALDVQVEGRTRFEERSAYELGLSDASFDLVVCRHVLHSVPHAERILAELTRVLRPGGFLHVLAEDYGMIQFEPRRLDASLFWQVGPRAFGEATGTDMENGRKAYRLLRQLGYEDITVDYLVVDPIRVPRETFATIWASWRDGYADAVAQVTPVTNEQFHAHFDDMIETIRDPDGYGVWFAPIVAGRRPSSRT